jgi:hypothetical protein
LQQPQRFLTTSIVNVGDNNFCARTCKAQSRNAAEPTRRSGDSDNLIRERESRWHRA